MPKITIGPTDTAQWHEIIQEAEYSYGIVLHEDLEHYLILLLKRFMQHPEVVGLRLADEYLQSFKEAGYLGQQKMRQVGDECLLFAGLYPETATQRRVPIRYFVDLGRSAYFSAAQCINQQLLVSELFKTLAREFVPMMDVLHSMRELAGLDQQLSHEHAVELCNEVGSEHARQLLQRNRGEIPFAEILRLTKL